MAACPTCGHQNAEGAKFCSECGARLEAPAARARETRKTVTVLFCDVAGSTALGERLDPETVRAVMTRYFERMRAVLESHGGTVEKFIGDAVMAVFGVPVVHEDDAVRAVRAADDMRSALAELNAELERERSVSIATRIGINTGPVVAGDPAAGQNLVTGDTVNTAARLEQAAGAGEILIGEATYDLVRDAVDAEPIDPLALKGKADAVPAYRVLAVRAGVAGHERRLDSPMVGRERPLRMLGDAFEASREDAACHLFTVFGTAGIGKSRLVREFLSSLDGRARVLTGRCLSYGDAVTYWPIAEMTLRAANIAEGDPPERARAAVTSLLEGAPDGDVVAQHLSRLLGFGGDGPVEPRWAIRRLFETLARRDPLVVVFDDLHWADDALLDAIEHVVDRSRDAAMLLVCMARPELLDQRSGWGGGARNATSVHLEPLSETEADALIENLLGMPALTPEIRERIRASAQGNPLFVEEMLAMLLDDGVLVQKDGGWVATVDLSTVPVPPAISALLAARLDRLTSDERAVLEAASIVGEVFERSSVAAIAAEIADDEIGRHLTSLLRKDLIRPSASDIGAEESFRFRHILLRDAAYEQIPKDDRASMHVAFADHLAGIAGERVHESDEFLGFHLARATELWTELDVADERVAAARERAFEHLRTAGTRAFGRADLGAAATLLSRAQSLVDPDDPRRLALVYELGQSLIETGALQEAEDTMRDLAERAGRANDLTAELQAETLGAAARFFRGSKTAIPEFGELADRLIEHCERVGDVRGSAIAWSHRAQHRWLVDLAAAEDAAERARAYARDAGDRYLQNEMRLLALASRGWGPAKVDEALAAAREAVADARRDGDRHVEGSALFGLAHMSAYLGDFDEARLCLEAGRELSLDLGLELERFATAQGAGQLEELAGDLDAAAAYLLESCEGLQQLGETAFLSTSAAKLADVEARRGNLAEAERWIEVADRTGAPEDQATRVYLALARGRLEGARGSDDMAEEHLRRAIDIAEESDAYPPRVETRIALAELLARRGRPEEARAVSDDAVAIARAKGSVSHERLARAVLDV